MGELFAANRLVPVRERRDEESRRVASYLDLAGCEGDRRTHAEALAGADPRLLVESVGWYLLERT